MTIVELSEKIKFDRAVACYNIFSLQSLQRYCGTILQGEIPYNLPGIELLGGKAKMFDAFCCENDKNLLNLKRAAEAFITRNWIKETFRGVESYCEEHQELDKFKKEDWHDFIRPYINAWSHGSTLDLKRQNKEIKKKLDEGSITYRGHELKWEMDGQRASLKMQTAYEICEGIISFVDEKLNGC